MLGASFGSAAKEKNLMALHQEFMAELEVMAAHNVLEACAQTDTIEKVVYTSSATAVIWRDRGGSLPSDFDERNWSDVNFCKKFKLWEGLSKTLAEKAAWALAMDREVNMVSINGGLLMSPDLTISHPYLKGAAEMYEDGVFVTVDLRFLEDAHICVFEDISSYGRYLCFNQEDISVIFSKADKDSSGTLTVKEFQDALDDICERYPQMQLYLKNKQMSNLVDILKESKGDVEKEAIALNIEEFKLALSQVDFQMKNLPATAGSRGCKNDGDGAW